MRTTQVVVKKQVKMREVASGFAAAQIVMVIDSGRPYKAANRQAFSGGSI
jgi:hypothetical protein